MLAERGPRRGVASAVDKSLGRTRKITQGFMRKPQAGLSPSAPSFARHAENRLVPCNRVEMFSSCRRSAVASPIFILTAHRIASTGPAIRFFRAIDAVQYELPLLHHLSNTSAPSSCSTMSRYGVTVTVRSSRPATSEWRIGAAHVALPVHSLCNYEL
jgi:hypothetical protein